MIDCQGGLLSAVALNGIAPGSAGFNAIGAATAGLESGARVKGSDNTYGWFLESRDSARGACGDGVAGRWREFSLQPAMDVPWWTGVRQESGATDRHDGVPARRRPDHAHIGRVIHDRSQTDD